MDIRVFGNSYRRHHVGLSWLSPPFGWVKLKFDGVVKGFLA